MPPSGKSEDWYRGYIEGLHFARQVMQDSADTVLEQMLDTPAKMEDDYAE